MRSSVIVFPGSNCDRDIAVALEKFQIKNQMIWHDESNLPKSDLVVLPGGFSYGDYLRTGCIASKSRIIKDVIKHAKDGRLVLGICNGFQILIETGLLPGVLLRNKKLRFLSKNIFLKVTNVNSKLHVEGPISSAVKTITNSDSPYTTTNRDSTILADTTLGSITVIVPTMYNGRKYIVKKVHASNTVTIDPDSGNVDGASTKALSSIYDFVEIQSDGSNWFIIGSS